MIYYRRNKKILEEFQNKEDKELLIYKDKEDIRNYAFTILYGNGINEIEQVIRTSDLENHYLAMKLLYKKSKYLKKFVTDKEASAEIQTNCIEHLANTGNAVIYNMISNRTMELGGLLYLPKNPTDWTKEYLCHHKEYLKCFKDMSIYQDAGALGINVLCEFGEHSHQSVLEKILK